MKRNSTTANGRRGNLFVVSAPSGTGKTTLCKLLCNSLDRIVHSVSFTTRQSRKGEINGVDYFFIDKEQFHKMARKGEFLEWAEVHGNYYGSSTKWIQKKMSDSIDVIMDIDTQGARQLIDKKVEATYVFILPPSLGTLKERLIERKTDTEEVILRRLSNAREEIRDYERYEYVIINDSLNVALDDLISVVRAVRCRQSNVNHEQIIRNLLKEVY